ncbi:hypothetical protein AB0L44_46220 [Nonomuraea wenchangensis]|uniref:ATP-dependent DNA ligase n=1 Tax=Nonomuraea wenchangensis TaxID=568860 RepID=UPI0034362487
MRRPYRERRERLHDLVTPGRHWQVPEMFNDAEAVLEATRRLGLEFIVCKQLASPYRPGRRSSTWTKVKRAQVADVVIGGDEAAVPDVIVSKAALMFDTDGKPRSYEVMAKNPTDNLLTVFSFVHGVPE